ncbi:MAG: hypothetical protein RL266_1137 [Bacteroidota bacterium]
MTQQIPKVLSSAVLVGLCLALSSWTGGPAPDSKSDSLAIVRVIQPVNELFKVKPVMYVSKGKGKIDQVEMNDSELADGNLLLKRTLTDFLSNGYTIQTATEVVDEGVKLNTYYLKKKIG